MKQHFSLRIPSVGPRSQSEDIPHPQSRRDMY